MKDKSLQDILSDLASQSSSGDGLNLRNLEAALRELGYKIDDNYPDVLRGLLEATKDSTLAENLHLNQQTIANTKTKIRKDLNKLLKAKNIETPKQKQDYLYIPKLNEAGFQITVTKKKSLKDTIILVCRAAYWDICRQYLRDIPTINQKWNSGLQRTLKEQIEEAAKQESSAENAKKTQENLNFSRTRKGRLESEENAKKTLKNFSKSSLAEQFNKVVCGNLPQSRIKEEQIKIITARITYRTAWHLKKNIYEFRNDVPKLADIYGSRLASEVQSYEEIEEQYLNKIANKPLEKVVLPNLLCKTNQQSAKLKGF